MEKNDEPRMVSAFEHENALMHYGNVNKRSMINQITFGVTVIILVIVFVVAYTVREQKLLDTIISLCNPSFATEAQQDGVHQFADP